MLSDSALAYLKKRGYTQADLVAEGIQSVPVGEATVEGVRIFTERESVAFVCRSMSETVVGISVAAVTGDKDYRAYVAPGRQHLAMTYGTEEDRELLFKTGQMVLVEGVYDRNAMKKILPEHAVFARLTKGTTGQMVEHLQVYCKQLYVAFDMDGPGQMTSERAEKKMPELGVETTVLKYPRKDPAKLLEDLGQREARRIVAKQIGGW